MIVPLFLVVSLCGSIAIPQEHTFKEYVRAATLVDENNFGSALAVYQALIKTPSPFIEIKKSRILNNMGYCYYRLGKNDEAYANYLRALEIDPRYFLCLNNISAVLIKQKKYEEALPQLQKAFFLHPEYIKVIFNLFVVYANLDDKESAMSYLKLAYRTDKAYTVKRLEVKNISDRNMGRIIKLLEIEDKN